MKKHLSRGGLIAIAFAIVALLYLFGTFTASEEKFNDLLFTKRTPKSNVVIVAIDDESLAEIGNWPWPRKTFADILPKLDTARTVGFDINFSGTSSLGISDDITLYNAFRKAKPSIVLPLELRSGGQISVEALALFSSNTTLGFVNVPVDADGIARKLDNQDGIYKSFSSRLAKPGTSVPSSERIWYDGPARTFLTVSFADVLNGKVPSDIFNGATVLIGATAPDLHDIVETPFGAMPGVEVHANAIDTLEGGRMLADSSKIVSLLLILLVSLLTGLAVASLKRVRSILIALAGLFTAILLAAIISFSSGAILPEIYMLLAFVLTIVLLIIFQYLTEAKEKQFIRSMFQYYLMPEVVNELIENPKKLVLGGEKKQVSILFSDIRGFTALSEKLSPEKLVHVMNQYLTVMSDCIMENKGLVDKYIGDAIMAFWGAPVANSDQATDACLAALEMSRKLKDLNERWRAEGLPEIGIGIGINTGEVIVGNMGSERRFNYTIMGDEVNFGSRLEGLNKAYGTECLISEETKKSIEKDSRFKTRELDRVMVKGKKEPKLIFELLTKPVTADFQKTLDLFAEGRAKYQEGAFTAASALFEQALSHSDDFASRVFLERSKQLALQSPESWDGVYEFKTK